MSPGQPSTKRLWLALGVVAVLVAGGVLAAILLSGGGGSGSSTAASVGGQSSGAATGPTVATVAVPSVVGLAQARATARLRAAGLSGIARPVRSPRVAGTVLGQNPAAGARLERGGLVGLVVSAGPGAGTVPRVVGLSAAEAAAKVREAGLSAQPRLVESDRRAGLVVAQAPAGGTRLARGTVVLSVSKGPPELTVPDVVGARRAQAVSRLQNAGFAAAVALQASTAAAGTVLAQLPGPGSPAARGSTVHLTVASRPGATPAKAAIPSLVGSLQADAVSRLRAVGLKARIMRVHSLLQVGSVVAQSPAAGTRVAGGTHVAISISTGPGP